MGGSGVPPEEKKKLNCLWVGVGSKRKNVVIGDES